MVLIRSYLLAVLACAAPAALASPTSDELLHCHQMASSALLRCLDQSPGYKNGNCWDTARSLNDTCYDNVRKEHRADTGRIEAERRAKEQRRQGRDAQ
ncbi:hypothetical protein [Noviherbaspirillum autotrophicum]|uniref:hypothetical protein n=1 Tax=Noviherbaspirillum autotrophicum TaxID=709839 RepID=UPI0012FE67BE|nr:hypothetical protein [Noviherbaspirillum autotrophicum]